MRPCSDLAAEYRANWTMALAKAPTAPACPTRRADKAYFNDVVCTTSRLAAWCAFWGEVQSRPIYQEHCAASNREYTSALEGICGRLIE